MVTLKIDSHLVIEYSNAIQKKNRIIIFGFVETKNWKKKNIVTPV